MRLWRLSHKELKETSRDRRTIITLLMMPLLVYPLLSMAMNRYLLTSDAEAVPYKIGVENEADGRWVQEILQSPDSTPPEEVLKSAGGQMAEFELFNTSDTLDGKPTTVSDSISRGTIDVGIESEGDPKSYRLYAFRGDLRSQNARRIFVERLQWYQLSQLEKAAPQVVAPEFEIVDEGEEQNEPILATIVPLVLVLMTITGAVYPAIDLTAGERERGTMEALMASPVPRFQVLLAKYFAVVVIAMLTAIANLAAMFTTLWLGGLLPLLTGSDVFPWLQVLQILGLLVLFSGFFSAVLLSLTSFARSFKEAQAYLIPVMLLSLAPGMLSLLPGVKLSGPLAVAPLINIVMLAREVLSGTVVPAAATMAVISTIGYAAAALSIAAHLFGSDAVTRTSDQSFASLLKRPKRWTAVPTPQTAAMVLALLVPIYFVCSNVLMKYLSGMRSIMLGSLDDLPLDSAVALQSRSMWLSATTLILVFGLIPLLATWLGRSRLLSTYRLHRPGVLAIVGATIVGLGAWAVAHEAFVIADALGIGGLSEKRIADTRKMLEAWQIIPPWVLLLTLAVTPAVIEELCFRGFLFSAVLRVMSPLRTILLTSFLFGLFHVLTGNALLIERFVPTFLLGLILGVIAYRTGSVIPGMAMHFVHNGLLEMVGHYYKQLEFIGADFDNQTHLPPHWIAIATTIAVAGMAIVWFAGRRRTLLVP
ncbi:ABC-2 family transporter protein [Rubripirellula obstinata]|uniref:ABC-2 family transporter protein n=1 Tax=Rubripirellula obstinata TaxID=406547 RepID=A0A5B1CDW7_9BACT|nr:ABC transporter permease subunit [Rubripirellula obstinata]KAA1258411.1 ABC-2 family transporter protein [Rubripirellula obstinata]